MGRAMPDIIRGMPMTSQGPTFPQFFRDIASLQEEEQATMLGESFN